MRPLIYLDAGESEPSHMERERKGERDEGKRGRVEGNPGHSGESPTVAVHPIHVRGEEVGKRIEEVGGEEGVGDVPHAVETRVPPSPERGTGGALHSRTPHSRTGRYWDACEVGSASGASYEARRGGALTPPCSPSGWSRSLAGPPDRLLSPESHSPRQADAPATPSLPGQCMPCMHK